MLHLRLLGIWWGFLSKAHYQQEKSPWSKLSARLNGSTVIEQDCDLSNSSSRSRLLEAPVSA